MESKNTQSSKIGGLSRLQIEMFNSVFLALGLSRNDVEQCTPACAEPFKTKMESRSIEHKV